MKEKALCLLNLLDNELNLYEELFFNEFDKGCLIYEHQIDLFNKKNEISSMILENIGKLIDQKKEIIEYFVKTCNDKEISIEKIINQFAPDKLDQYHNIKDKLRNILVLLSDLNLKNKILFDATYSVSKIVIDGLKKENIYNEKGSLCDSYFSTVRYSV